MLTEILQRTTSMTVLEAQDQMIVTPNRVYVIPPNREPALWEWDHRPEGFQWIDCQDWQQSIVSYVRRAKESWLVVVLNLTPVPHFGYRIGVPEAPYYREG